MRFIFVLSQATLYMQGRVRMGQLAVAGPDLILRILFIVSFFKLASRSGSADTGGAGVRSSRELIDV